jgi:hypothetical protein
VDRGVIRRRWIGFGLLLLVVGVLVVLRGSSANDSTDHSSLSDGNNGTSALRLYAQALGYSTSTVEGDFSLPSNRSLLFVFSPDQSTGYSIAAAQQLQQWVAAGNVLVYAAEGGDPILDSGFGLRRSATAVSGTAHAAAPIYGGVNRLSGGSDVGYFQTTATQVPILRSEGAEVLGVRFTVGSGSVVALTDPLPLCNAYLGLADNGRFAADLLAMTPTGGSVLFDEYHHGLVAGGAPTALSWVTTPWGAALALAVLVILAGLAMRGRTFGPTVPLYGTRDRSSAEYTAAVGNLLHRTGARSVTMQTLLAATRRTLAERVGLSRDTPQDQVDTALAQRAPAAGRELIALESAISRQVASEEEVLDIARRLHALAYPPSTTASVKGS